MLKEDRPATVRTECSSAYECEDALTKAEAAGIDYIMPIGVARAARGWAHS